MHCAQRSNLSVLKWGINHDMAFKKYVIQIEMNIQFLILLKFDIGERFYFIS